MPFDGEARIFTFADCFGRGTIQSSSLSLSLPSVDSTLPACASSVKSLSTSPRLLASLLLWRPPVDVARRALPPPPLFAARASAARVPCSVVKFTSVENRVAQLWGARWNKDAGWLQGEGRSAPAGGAVDAAGGTASVAAAFQGRPAPRPGCLPVACRLELAALGFLGRGTSSSTTLPSFRRCARLQVPRFTISPTSLVKQSRQTSSFPPKHKNTVKNVPVVFGGVHTKTTCDVPEVFTVSVVWRICFSRVSIYLHANGVLVRWLLQLCADRNRCRHLRRARETLRARSASLPSVKIPRDAHARKPAPAARRLHR